METDELIKQITTIIRDVGATEGLPIVVNSDAEGDMVISNIYIHEGVLNVDVDGTKT